MKLRIKACVKKAEVRVSKLYKWVIMSAWSWISGRKTPAEFVKASGDYDMTIMVATLITGYPETSKKVFVMGSRGGYGEIGATMPYVVDTGRGYSATGRALIENAITVDAEGNLTGINDVGMNEKRPLWVFK